MNMNQLYPLKFKPVFRDKIWGGDKIRTVLNKDFSPLPNCGEVWVVSGVKGSQTLVDNGFLEGNELNELVEVYMGDLVGEAAFEKYGNEFPLLIKFIDAKDWLSIQVHPDDELARERRIGNGKTEMWYVIEADRGSQLISGFGTRVNRNQYLGHLKNNTLKEIMNFEEVNAGDVFYMPAGRVHALGPGIMLAEIQQTSDTTYRIYDWDRTDAKGKGRELHTREALDAIDFEVYPDYKTRYQPKLNETVSLVDSDHFTTNLMELTEKVDKDLSLMDSFVLYICVEGSAELMWDNDPGISLKTGDAVLVPAIMDMLMIRPVKKSKILEVFIK
jgi:mannose-6-phosphate isomerase